jgi:FkbM family methyltransferase
MFYSQCKEDKVIYEKYIKNLNIINPIYLEMGAMNGITYSNTYFFEVELGFTGILIEPNPYEFEKLNKNRPNNRNYNYLVSDCEDDIEYTYYNCNELSAISGVTSTLTESNINIFYKRNNDWLSSKIDNNLFHINIKPKTLSYIIKDSGFEKIDFFSLDVEGHELNVLNSFNWEIPINMILVENNQDTMKVDLLLRNKNYIFMETIGPNSFYILSDFYNNNKHLFNI